MTKNYLFKRVSARESSYHRTILSELVKTVTIVIVMLTSVTVKAQLISTDTNLASSIYDIDAVNQRLNSQKILKYTDSISIILSVSEETQKACFYALQKGNTSITQRVEIPSQYLVSDFSILDDYLYFCGYTPNGTANEPDSLGFVAYFSINEAFGGDNLTVTYTIVPTTTEVRRIETYNGAETPIVVGIGRQFYANPPTYMEPPINGGPPTILDPETSFPTLKSFSYPLVGVMHTYYPWNYYDCFFIYKVRPNYNQNSDYYYNDVLIYRHKNSQTDSTIPPEDKYKYETFKDIALTEDYICLVSAYDYDTVGSNSIRNSWDVVLRRFDKNNFTQLSKKQALRYGQITDEYGFKLEALNKNNVAYSYLYQGNNTWGDIVCKANIDDSDTTFEFVHAQKITEETKLRLVDMEYLPEEDDLLVMFKYSSDQITSSTYSYNEIYYVDMYEWIFEGQITGSYDFYYMTASPFQDYRDIKERWNSLLRYDNSHFAIAGTIELQPGKLKLFDKKTYNLNSSPCQKLYPYKVYALEISTFIPFDDLEQCWWRKIIGQGYVSNYGIGNNIYEAVLDFFELNAGENNIEINCETNE
jgi:hypothetical protein